MRKHPPDVNVSETCIDANFKMVERRDPDNFPRFPTQERCAWTIPEIALKKSRKLSMPIDIQLHLIHSMIVSILLYGSEVWCCENTDIINQFQLYFCKMLLGLKQSTHYIMI